MPYPPCLEVVSGLGALAMKRAERDSVLLAFPSRPYFFLPKTPASLQAAQRDGGQPDVEQHAPSLATSAAGRRLRASRHNSALRAPKAPQPLHLCALRQPARNQARRQRRNPVGWAAYTALRVDEIPPPSWRGCDQVPLRPSQRTASSNATGSGGSGTVLTSELVRLACRALTASHETLIRLCACIWCQW